MPVDFAIINGYNNVINKKGMKTNERFDKTRTLHEQRN